MENFENKTKEQLIEKIEMLNNRILTLEREKNECKRVEQELIEKEIEIELITKSSLDTIFILTKTGNITFISLSAKDHFGYEPEDMLGTSFTKYCPKNELPLYWKMLKEVFLKKKVKNFETRIIQKDGSIIPVEINGQIIKKNGKFFGQGTIRNITERKKTEEKEKEHQKNIRLLSETTMKFVELSSDENIYHFIGEQLRKLIGKDSYIVVNSVDEKQEVSTTRAVFGMGKFIDKITKLLRKHPVGMTVNIQHKNMYYMSNCKMHLYNDGLYGLLLQTVPKAICTSIEKLLKIDKIHTIDFIKGKQLLGTAVVFLKEGAEEIKNMEIIETFIKQSSIAIQQRLAEEALKASNENFQQVVSNITTAVWKADIGKNGAFENTYTSSVIDELLELPTGTIKNDWDKYFSYIKPKYQEQVNNAFREAITSPAKKIECEYEVLKNNGQTTWFYSKGRCFRKNGKLHVFGSTTDITKRKLTEEEIKAKNLFLESLIQQSPLPTFVMNSKGFNVMVNEAFLKFYAVPGKEMILGRNAITEPANIKQGVIKYFKEALKGKIVETPEIEFVSPYKNKKIITRCRMFPILDPTGTLTNVVVMQEDITGRKQAEESLQESESQKKAILDGITTNLAFVNENLEILWVNKASAISVGKSPEEMIGQKCYEVWADPEKPCDDCPTLKAWKTRKSEHAIMNTPDGRVWDERGEPVFDKNGELIGMVEIAHDITERKKAEEELTKHREHLEELVKERTAKLEEKTNKLEKSQKSLTLLIKDVNESRKELGEVNKDLKEKTKKLEESQRSLTLLLEDVNESRAELDISNTKLESANKELESFSYSVSHDLRAPLRAIDGFSRLILEDYYDTLDNEGKESLNIIRNNTKLMGQLIDDLLEFSRLGRKSLKSYPIKLKDMINEIFHEQRNLFPDRIIDIKLKSIPDINGDNSMIRQVIVNLISNAIKFTENKKRSIIEFGSTKDENEIIYYIKDNGVGFDMQYVDKLFGVFQRLHSSEEFEGTGVGLALIKRIINKHGGKVWAESEVNKGATFYFSMPFV